MSQGKVDCRPFRQRTSVSKVRVEENGRSAVFRNERREQMFVTKVDGGLVENRLAADYVVSKPGSGDLIVELKGKDVAHGCAQVLATAQLLDQCGGTRGPFGALIVCTRVPANDAKAARLKNAFFQKYRARLHIRAGNMEHDFAELLGKKV